MPLNIAHKTLMEILLEHGFITESEFMSLQQGIA